MNLSTVVASEHSGPRKAAEKSPKTNGSASLFQGILAKEMERGRPAGKTLEPKDTRKLSLVSGIKDDALGKSANKEGKPAAGLQTQVPQVAKEPVRRLKDQDTPENVAHLPALPALGMEMTAVPVKISTRSDTRKSGASQETQGIQGSDDRQAKRKNLRTRDEDSNSIQDTRLIQVVDRRTQVKKPEAPVEAAVPVGAKALGDRGRDEVQIQYTSTRGFTSEGAGGKIQAPVSRAMGESLFAHLQDKANLEIVDKAKIILKDAGQGEIRLIIKPEALGEVKIRLNLDEGHLAGKIIVENNTVKDLFQKNMDSLLDSFRQGGFTGLDIQVSVGNQSGSQDGYRERAAVLESYSNTQGLSTGLSEEPRLATVSSGSGLLDLVI